MCIRHVHLVQVPHNICLISQPTVLSISMSLTTVSLSVFLFPGVLSVSVLSVSFVLVLYLVFPLLFGTNSGLKWANSDSNYSDSNCAHAKGWVLSKSACIHM